MPETFTTEELRARITRGLGDDAISAEALRARMGVAQQDETPEPGFAESFFRPDTFGGTTLSERPASRSLDEVSEFLDPLLQGLALGGGDELTAALIAATPERFRMTMGAASPTENFETALARVRARSADIAERKPGIATANQLIGGLTTGGIVTAPLKGVPFIARTMGELGQAVLVGGAVGAGFGGVSGFLSGEEGERIDQMIEGAEFGGAIGITLPVLASAAAAGLTALISRFSAGAAERAAIERLRIALQRDEITPQDAAARLREMGINATVADTAGENVTGLARAAQSIPGPARNLGARVLNLRQQLQSGRLTEIMNNLFRRVHSFKETRDDLLNARAAASTPAYRQAYAQEIPFKQRVSVGEGRLLSMEDLMSRPAIQEAWRRAQIIARNSDIELPEILTVAENGTDLVLNRTVVPNVQAIDFIKRGLDDIIETSREPLTGKIVGDVARGVLAARRDLLAVVDELVPSYAAARAIYSGPAAMIDALDQGRRFSRLLNTRGRLDADAEQITETLAEMTEAERAMFRHGMAEGLIDMISTSPDTANATRQLIGSVARRDRIRAAFPDSETFTRFMSALRTEERFFETRRDVLTNSITGRLIEEQRDIGSGLPADGPLRALFRGQPIRAVGQFFERVARPNARTLEEIGNVMFAQGDEAAGALAAAALPGGIPPRLQQATATALAESSRQAGQGDTATAEEIEE